MWSDCPLDLGTDFLVGNMLLKHYRKRKESPSPLFLPSPNCRLFVHIIGSVINQLLTLIQWHTCCFVSCALYKFKRYFWLLWSKKPFMSMPWVFIWSSLTKVLILALFRGYEDKICSTMVIDYLPWGLHFHTAFWWPWPTIKPQGHMGIEKVNLQNVFPW